MGTNDQSGEPGQSTSTRRDREGTRRARPAKTDPEPVMPMVRCAACDAPNVTDRDTCWRCLRSLSDPAPEPEPEVVPEVGEAGAELTGVELTRVESATTDCSRVSDAPMSPAVGWQAPTSRSPGVPTPPLARPAAATVVAAPLSEPLAPAVLPSPPPPPPPTPRVVMPLDPTPIKVTPVRRAGPTIMPTAWPPPGGARRGRRRGRSVIASVAALLTLAIAGLVLVDGWLPTLAEPTDPTTAGLVDRSSRAVRGAARRRDPHCRPPCGRSRPHLRPRSTIRSSRPRPSARGGRDRQRPRLRTRLRPRLPEPADRPRAPDPALPDEVATPEIREASDRSGDTPSVGSSFTCGNDAEPIRDPFDRTWGVSKISYSTQPGYERVVLHLRRIGEARPGRGASAIAGRVPTSRIEDFPDSVRPEKEKRRLLRVDLAGVPEGPDMRGFRLTGLGHVGELSMLPGKNGKTALLAIDSDACYRVRVPGWDLQVDADARYTEVIIDVKSP